MRQPERCAVELLGEGRGARSMGLHRSRARNGRFAGLDCGRRCLLGGFIGVLGRGDILVAMASSFK